MSTEVTRVALDFLKSIKANWAARIEEYAAECAQDRKEGHRPSHCIHGAYLWVDWDVICGRCEDGDTPLDLYQEALGQARRFLAQKDELHKALVVLRNLEVLDLDQVITLYADGLEKFRKF